MGDTFHCKRCGRIIKNKDSIIHGYGPVCWSKIKPTNLNITSNSEYIQNVKIIKNTLPCGININTNEKDKPHLECKLYNCINFDKCPRKLFFIRRFKQVFG
jgi:YbbR domain-containing protein